MVIDYRREPPPTPVTAINGQPVEVVGSYTVSTAEASFMKICKKGQPRLFCLRKMAKFNVDKTIMRLFYKSYIEYFLSANGHPLHPEFQLLPSKLRFSFPRAKTNRYSHSFAPSAISLLSSDVGALG